MDIVEIDKFLPKKTCDYCIKFFDADKKHKVSMVTKGPRYVILAWYNKN